MPDGSTAPIPVDTMLLNPSSSLTWNRYEKLAVVMFRPKLTRPETVGDTATDVCSNSGNKPIGGVTFRFEPSAFNALADSRTAVGDAGEFIAPWHPAAAMA